jgi:hypothetical protein
MREACSQRLDICDHVPREDDRQTFFFFEQEYIISAEVFTWVKGRRTVDGFSFCTFLHNNLDDSDITL